MISGPLISRALITQISADSSELRVFPPHSETSSAGRYSLPRQSHPLSHLFKTQRRGCLTNFLSEDHTFADLNTCMCISDYICMIFIKYIQILKLLIIKKIYKSVLFSFILIKIIYMHLLVIIV